MTGARGSPGKRVNLSFRFAVYTLPNTTFITIFTIVCSCGTTVRSRRRYFLPYCGLSQPEPEDNTKLWFYQTN